MLKNKKSQTMIEFLTTYGWAILVIMVAIGALAYFGVLSPNMPETCIFPPGMDCIGKAQINKTEVVFVITNNQGHSINITNINSLDIIITSYSLGIGAGNLSGSNNYLFVKDNEKVTIVARGNIGDSGNKFRAYFNIDYIDGETGLQQTVEGKITGRIA